MVNRERFMLDLDSEGFTADPSPAEGLASINIGKLPDVKMAHDLLADTRCLRCPPSEQCSRSGTCEHRNNLKGWDEVDGTKLPLITWAELDHDLAQMHITAVNNMDGITRLSDSYAPDAFFGHKS